MVMVAAVVTGMILASGCAIASPGFTGATFWSASDLKSVDRTLAAKMGRSGAAYTALITGKHYG
ncbi:MAG: hypothetical protein ACREU2_18595, partial [Steroidobacteraceae bacterium]